MQDHQACPRTTGRPHLLQGGRGSDLVWAQEAQELPSRVGLPDGEDEDEEARHVCLRRPKAAVEGRHDARL